MVEVSVLLVTYNHEPYIEQALESVLQQETTCSYEVLISEDRSTDRTRDIVLDYADRYPDRIRLFLSEENQNDMEVCLRGLRAAQGEFIAYLDGDDYWLPGKLQRQVEFMHEHPECPMSFHAVEMVPEGGETTIRRHPRPWHSMSELLRGNRIGACSVLYRRDVIADIPAWFADIDVLDWSLALLAAERGDLGYIDEPLGAYRLHGTGVWTSAAARRRAEWEVRFLTYLRDHVGEEHREDTELALASARARLAKAAVEEGDRGAAANAVLRSLREVPHHPELPTGKRLKVLARASAPGPYEAMKSLRRQLLRNRAT
jgi:glycosyltransferase involved in cell wall biosynthesis